MGWDWGWVMVFPQNNWSPHGPNIAAILGHPLLLTAAFGNCLFHSVCIWRTAWTLPVQSKLARWGNICWSLYRMGRWQHSHWRIIGVMDAEWKVGKRYRFIVFAYGAMDGPRGTNYSAVDSTCSPDQWQVLPTNPPMGSLATCILKLHI